MNLKLTSLEASIMRLALGAYKIKMDRWASEDEELEPGNVEIWRDNAEISQQIIEKLGGASK